MQIARHDTQSSSYMPYATQQETCNSQSLHIHATRTTTHGPFAEYRCLCRLNRNLHQTCRTADIHPPYASKIRMHLTQSHRIPTHRCVIGRRTHTHMPLSPGRQTRCIKHMPHAKLRGRQYASRCTLKPSPDTGKDENGLQRQSDCNKYKTLLPPTAPRYRIHTQTKSRKHPSIQYSNITCRSPSLLCTDCQSAIKKEAGRPDLPNFPTTIYLYTGRLKRNSRPPPLRFLAVMVPPCNDTIFFTMESPRPEPPASRVLPSSVR